jgi:hypothetical protein
MNDERNCVYGRRRNTWGWPWMNPKIEERSPAAGRPHPAKSPGRKRHASFEITRLYVVWTALCSDRYKASSRLLRQVIFHVYENFLLHSIRLKIRFLDQVQRFLG